MIRLIKWLFILFFLIGMIMGILAVNSLDTYATVSKPAELSSDELKRVKQFIKDNNPANLQTGQTARSEISQDDLNQLLNYLAQRAPQIVRQRLRLKAVFDSQQAMLQSSFRLPNNPVGEYINISASLHSKTSAARPSIEISSLQIGKNKIPDFITQLLAPMLHQQLMQKVPEYNVISQSVQNIGFNKKSLSISYVWDEQAAEKMKSQLSARVISGEFKEALIAHANYLARISYSLPAKPTFNQILRPMFSYAKSRSKTKNPIIENRAVFIAMGAYALDKNIPNLLGETAEVEARNKRIYLKGRHDLSKHLMLSAAITSMADPVMAGSIGLQKEVKDSQGGSGFSFTDLAADHAGIALAEKAIASKENAVKVQKFLSRSKAESDYMPAIDNLPEGIQKRDFEYQYVSTDGVEYKKIERLIAERIRSLPVYKGMN